jgi:class 3 adenylate cyclase
MAVLFSDVVASTEQASALGGERWKRLLDRHDQLARTCIGRRGGTLIKTTGDGIVATLPSAISTIRAAQELRAVSLRKGSTSGSASTSATSTAAVTTSPASR